MRLPCEIVIIDILPIIRKELSVRLVEAHGLMKADVARMFDVSGTAISQYIHGTRGDNRLVSDCPDYDKFIKEIVTSAEKIATNENTVLNELCRICDFVKKIGMHDHIHGKNNEGKPLAKCIECPGQYLC
jgi:hypothetical protein